MASQVFCDISLSLDGFIAGPNDAPENPMGDNGEEVHNWLTRLRAWREKNGMQGGDTGPDNDLVLDSFGSIGAVVMGRRMFDNGFEPWGDTPPYHAPVYVLTHRPQPPIEKLGGTTYHFVDTDIKDAVRMARAAAGDLNVSIAGGAAVVQQALRASLIDRMKAHVAPVLLGGGVRLFDDIGAYQPAVTVEKIVASPVVAHFILERRE